MLAEIILQYRATENEPQIPDYQEEVDVTCVTELANRAYEMLKQSGADNVNFCFIGENNG